MKISLNLRRFYPLAFMILASSVLSCSAETGQAVSPEKLHGNSQNPASSKVSPATVGSSVAVSVHPGSAWQKYSPDMEQLFRNYIRPDAPGCVAGVYQEGELVLSGAYGMANLDHGIPLSDSSRFYMASVSKQVTAAAAGLLVVRGKLDLDKPVSEYIDGWPEWAEGITVSHLFNHTSGLPDIYDLMAIAGISLSDVMSIDDYMSVFFNGESLKHLPGQRYSYTNSGYTTLAKLVETVSGDDFSVFVDNEILGPLGMSASHFHDDRHRIIPNRVISYAPARGLSEEPLFSDVDPDRNDSALPEPVFRQTYLSNFQGVGPGGLYSTVRDWARWEALWSGGYSALALEEERVVEFQKLKELMTRQMVINGDTLDYAMGLDITQWQGQVMQGHSGSFMGFRTDVRRFPEHGLALLTLCNREDANPGRSNREMARIFLKEHFEAFLLPYQGVYRSEELQVDYTITVEQGTLKLHRRLSPNGLIREDAPDMWRAGSWDLVFQRNEEGEISGFLVSTGRSKEVAFDRVPELIIP